MIIDHNDPGYRKRWWTSAGKYNGAFFYSKEIVRNIIPEIKTTRNWLTVNTYDKCPNHTIVFIHNNMHPENYDWLKEAQDLVLVCGVPETCEKVAHLGKTIYLPLSVDKHAVERFKRIKTKGTAYVGRMDKTKGTKLPNPITMLCGMERNKLLEKMAAYEKVYAVGRCAIEAKILECEVLPYDPRFPDPSVWKVLDNKEAAKILQKELNKIDG